MNTCRLNSETAIHDRSGSGAVAYAATALRQDLRRKLGLERGDAPDGGAARIELRLDDSGGASGFIFGSSTQNGRSIRPRKFNVHSTFFPAWRCTALRQ